MKKRLFCKSCGDPIRHWQQETMVNGMHKGCVALAKKAGRSLLARLLFLSY